eukprot:TRINITY_DN20101_c0_g1_i2.p1 TRINITY_DN20101_c0_g1~~TRINITY_DN20101_c0_g1_i2.p1  ORF type:complete len:203 (+),score=49.67 TRINITY_DN20101_c0_g1_i2:63-671(+)
MCIRDSKKNFPPNSGYDYSSVKLMLARVASNGMGKFVAGMMDSMIEVNVAERLRAGEYFLRIRVDWYHKKDYEFVLSAYGPDQVTIVSIPKPPNFLRNLAYYYARDSKAQRYDFAADGAPSCYRLQEMTAAGFGFIYYRNDSDKTVGEQINFEGSKGIELSKERPGTKTVFMSVKPKSENLILLKLSEDYEIRVKFLNRLVQ